MDANYTTSIDSTEYRCIISLALKPVIEYCVS